MQHLQEIAPGSTDHLVGQAVYVYYTLKDYNQAHDIISQALSMNPSDVRVIELKSWIERRQGDFKHFQQSIQDLCQLHETQNCGWEVYIANREYLAALGSIEQTKTEPARFVIGSTELNRIFTYWLMQDQASLAQRLPDSRYGGG